MSVCACVYVYVCTCVCAHERERKRKRERVTDWRKKTLNIWEYLKNFPYLFFTPITPNSVKKSEVTELSHQEPLKCAEDITVQNKLGIFCRPHWRSATSVPLSLLGIKKDCTIRALSLGGSIYFWPTHSGRKCLTRWGSKKSLNNLSALSSSAVLPRRLCDGFWSHGWNWPGSLITPDS